MSNEVKTKEKVNMDPKYIIKLTVTLLLTCMVVAGLLGWVNSITKDKIAAITWEKTVAAMQKVIEADDFSDAMELTDDMTAAATAQGGTLAAVYQAQSGGQPVGYAINVEASGSQGTISMMVGIDMDGAVTGVSIVTNSETSGIGSKVMSNEPLTNGTRVLPEDVDWVTCSPKGDTPVALKRIDELKVVFLGQDVEEIANRHAAMHYFLQPCSSPVYDGGNNIQATVKYILDHPHWRLSLQTHKLIGIE